MREIKFRLYDKRDKRMIYPTIESIDLYSLSFCGDSWQVEFDNSEDDKKYFGEETFELMQFTGLKDKNGKEIYGGDIVKECSWEDYRTNPNRRWVNGREIVWNENEAGFVFKEDDGSLDCFSLNIRCGYEIIGNIYENPELIRKDS
jgi:uncharacterized phage protein (TIGR01671 family)